MIYKGINNEYIELKEVKKGEAVSFETELSYPLSFVWVRGRYSLITTYEGTKIRLEDNSILCLTAFHKMEFNLQDEARVIKFNREFYCILDHDREVSCKGILFYGANQLPLFQIPKEEINKFETLWQMFRIEMQSKDELQLEMLQMMLKRFIILCTRLYKSQNNFLKLENKETDIAREFNFLVEQYFKTKYTIKDYADLLNKSPKTVSNIFKKLTGKTALQIIHERKLLEVKRLLRYTEKPIKEIAYKVGFEDIQTFSRFFKKIEKISPSEFRKLMLGNIANSTGKLP
jgi:AraC-like DNA-binding protein